MMSDYALEQAELKEAQRIEEAERNAFRNIFGRYVNLTDKTEEAREDIDRHYERESRIVESQLHNQYA